MLLGLALLAIAGGRLADRYDIPVRVEEWAQSHQMGWFGWWVIAALAYIVGTALVWSPLDLAAANATRRPDMIIGLFARENLARVLVGLGLAIGAMWWFSQWKFTTQPVLRAIVVPPAILVGLALLFAPWWMRLIRQVGVERMERVREFERAEIAAHLHDSVLQTLTLIRKHAAEPAMVARLARAQERDLRSYLYRDRLTAEESVATALGVAIDAVEDANAVAIETVSVGDAPTDKRLRAAVAAAKEAAANAARHGKPPISVYAEVTADRYQVYVRDSGPGFDPRRIPEDRLGIRNSIIGRVKRHGGTATIASKKGQRTEVHITMPRPADGGMPFGAEKGVVES